MTTPPQGERKGVLDILREHEEKIRHLTEQVQAANDRIASLNVKIERLKGTHGY